MLILSPKSMPSISHPPEVPLHFYCFVCRILLVLKVNALKDINSSKDNRILMFQLFFKVPICSTQICVYKQTQISQFQVTLHKWGDQKTNTFSFSRVHYLDLTFKQLGCKIQASTCLYNYMNRCLSVSNPSAVKRVKVGLQQNYSFPNHYLLSQVCIL